MVYPGGSLTAALTFLDGFFHRAAQVSAAHTVFDGDVPGVCFAVDFGTAVRHLHLRQLRQRNTLARGANKRIFSIASFVSRYSGK